jgi:hypothetical protein
MYSAMSSQISLSFVQYSAMTSQNIRPYFEYFLPSFIKMPGVFLPTFCPDVL